MPQFAAGIGHPELELFLLDTRNDNTTVFGTSCLQDDATESCTLAPALFNCGLATTVTLEKYNEYLSGGYTTQGYTYEAAIYNDVNGTVYTKTSQGINNAANLTANAW